MPLAVHTPKPLTPMPLRESLLLFLVPAMVFVFLTYVLLPALCR